MMMINEINEPVEFIVKFNISQQIQEEFNHNDDDDDKCPIMNDSNHGDMEIIKLNRSKTLFQRPLYSIQQKDIPLIRKLLKKKDRILLPIYHTNNAMYSCLTNEMNMKIMEYMIQTKAYLLYDNFTYDLHKEYVNKIIQQVKLLLNNLLEENFINVEHYHQMKYHSTAIQFDSIIFLPHISQEIEFHPISISKFGPTISIANYIQRLLQPIYDELTNKITFYKGSDALYALELYQQDKYLTSTTQLIKFNIKNIYNLFSHDIIVQILQRFLNEHYYYNNDNMDKKAIIELVQFILKNQYFIYNKQFYQQIHSIQEGLPLMTLLIDICMYYCQEDLIKILNEKKQLFGRCFDTILCTWNTSLLEFQIIIDTMNIKYPFLFLQYTYGRSMIYLDTQIYLNKNKIYSNIYHSYAGEPYALPITSNQYDRLEFSKLIHSTLIRTIQCCNQIQTFQQELKHLESKLRFNQYSIDFIKLKMKTFFQQYSPTKQMLHDNDQQNYNILRQNIINSERNNSTYNIKRLQAIKRREIWYRDNSYTKKRLIQFNITHHNSKIKKKK